MKYYEFKTVEKYNETYMADEEKAELINNAIKILKSDNIYKRGFKTIGVKQVDIKDKIKNIYYYEGCFMETYCVLKIELSSKNYLILQEEEHPQLFKLFNKRFNELWEQEKQEQQEQAEQPQNDYYLRKHDKGKAKLLQVPVEAIQAISEIMDYGSQKYGANSWQQVEIERYINAGLRHIYASQKDIGAKDEESGKEHLKHALCNLAYAVALYEMKKADNEK